MKRSPLLLAVLAVAMLAGCTHRPEIEVREIPVPTPVTCVDPAAIPAEPPRVARLFNGNARHDLEILAENAQALRQWGQEMRSLLEKCVGKAPQR